MFRWRAGLARCALGAGLVFISSFDDSDSGGSDADSSDSGASNAGSSDSGGSDSGSSDSGGSSGGGDTGSSLLSSADNNQTYTGQAVSRRRRGVMPVRDDGQPDLNALTDRDYGDIPRG